MSEVSMKVKLLAHTQLAQEFFVELSPETVQRMSNGITDGQIVAFTAIRNCYSHLQPSEIFETEVDKYFGKEASDGGKGTDADRLCRHITSSGHTSTLEHVSFTLAIENVSRALLAQLTRHRVGFSFSVKSQRYVKFGSNNKSGGADYVTPDKIAENDEAYKQFMEFQTHAQEVYDNLRALGIPAEDARSVLTNATGTSIVMTGNISSLVSFYSKRRVGRGAQAEIANLAEAIRREVVSVEPWLEDFFENA